MKPLIIGLDVDDVILSLITEWLRAYNLATGDNLLPEDIIGWNIGQQVGLMESDDFYKLLTICDLYRDIQPVCGARKVVYELLSKGHRVVYIRSCVGNTMGQKVDALVRWGFLTEKNKHRDFIAASDKSLVSGVDVLFDEHAKNVDAFPRSAFLVDVPHNRATPCGRPRVSLQDIPLIVEALALSPYRDSL